MALFELKQNLLYTSQLPKLAKNVGFLGKTFL
jgi:hypothetical protein